MAWPVARPVEEVSVLARWTSERAAPKDRPPLFSGARIVADDDCRSRGLVISCSQGGDAVNTGTIPTQRTPNKPLERVIVLESISNHPGENFGRYEDELTAIFGFDPGSDPDPSEWFPPEEFSRFRPYLETARRARRASLLAVEALGRRRVMARDIAGRDRATKDHAKASGDRDAANAQQRRLDRDGLGEIRLRVADRLGIRRQGLELPVDLSFF
jgi:hypothetical protein